MSVPQRAINAALNGPEAKKVRIYGHEFNVKPLSISVNVNGETIAFGQISHHLAGRTDDQHWFGFMKTANGTVPNKVSAMHLKKKKGGVVGTLLELRPVLDYLAEKFFGEDADEFYKKLDEYEEDLEYLDFDRGYEKSIEKFLEVISERVSAPGNPGFHGLKVYRGKNFENEDMTIEVGDDQQRIRDSWNDEISSLIAVVPAGRRLEIFGRYNFNDEGNSLKLDSGRHFIKDLSIHEMNNIISSIRWV